MSNALRDWTLSKSKRPLREDALALTRRNPLYYSYCVCILKLPLNRKKKVCIERRDQVLNNLLAEFIGGPF